MTKAYLGHNAINFLTLSGSSEASLDGYQEMLGGVNTVSVLTPDSGTFWRTLVSVMGLIQPAGLCTGPNLRGRLL